MSITICRDALHHTWASGGDALVAVFDSLCEIGRECATVSGASDECEETTTASDADANMSCHVIPEDETYRLRLLVDASRECQSPLYCMFLCIAGDHNYFMVVSLVQRSDSW